MRIPRKLYISGWVIKIKYHDKLVVDGTECDGCYDPNKQEIWLQKGMPPAKRRETFLHEFIEMLTDIYGIQMSHENIRIVGLALSQLFANHKIELKQEDT